MKTSSKMEIVIPTWAGRTGPSFWGDQEYTGSDNQSSSFWVSRCVLPGERDSDMNDDCRAIGSTIDGGRKVALADKLRHKASHFEVAADTVAAS